MSKKLKYGTCLLVYSVQELAKQNLGAIPPRYIQFHHQQEEDAIVVEAGNELSQIPVILDMQSLLSQESGILSWLSFTLLAKNRVSSRSLFSNLSSASLTIVPSIVQNCGCDYIVFNKIVKKCDFSSVIL